LRQEILAREISLDQWMIRIGLVFLVRNIRRGQESFVII
jgi:hypothetical protein